MESGDEATGIIVPACTLTGPVSVECPPSTVSATRPTTTRASSAAYRSRTTYVSHNTSPVTRRRSHRLSITKTSHCSSSDTSNSIRALQEAKTPPSSFFFFQAEDGIRDYKVTGVQTCALPI